MPTKPTKPTKPPARSPVLPRKAQADATRRRLIAAALEAFATRSFDTVAVHEIADAAAVAHGLVFHYFGSKRGLYLEALRDVARQLADVHAVPASDAPAVRIRALLKRHMGFMRRHRKLALHLFRGGLGTDPEAWQIIDEARDRATAWIAVELGLAPGHRALRLMLRALAGAIDEATVHWLAHSRSAGLDSLIDALIEMVAAALRGAARLDPTLDVGAALRALGMD